MDASAHHEAAPAQIIRDQRGLVLGRIERLASTGKFVARDARGLVVGTYDTRECATRDAHGLIIARADILAALLVR